MEIVGILIRCIAAGILLACPNGCFINAIHQEVVYVMTYNVKVGVKMSTIIDCAKGR